MSWKITGTGNATGASSGLITGVGDGLALAAGVLSATVTSGLDIDASGNIVVKNGSGIAIDASGTVTVNPGAGLTTTSDGFLTVNPGDGLTTSGDQIVIPGGAITNTMLQALSVSTANIQAGAVGATQIANAAITTAKIQDAAITTAKIATAAITHALIGTAAIGTANIQNAAVTSAIIANAAVGDAHINDVSANKITAGTITATVSMTSPVITSTSGSTSVTLAGGAVTCALGAKEAVLSNAVLRVSDASFGKSCTMSEGGITGNDGGSHSFVAGLAGIAYANGSKSFSVDLAGGSSNVALSGYALTFGGVTILNSSGDIARAKFTGIPWFAGTNSTGGGAASLGSNCPAGTDLSKPYKWIEVQAADGTLGWVPMWN